METYEVIMQLHIRAFFFMLRSERFQPMIYWLVRWQTKLDYITNLQSTSDRLMVYLSTRLMVYLSTLLMILKHSVDCSQ